MSMRWRWRLFWPAAIASVALSAGSVLAESPTNQEQGQVTTRAPVARPVPAHSTSVLVPATYTTVFFQRYQDPDDPTLLHEAHVAYRLNNAPEWNLVGWNGLPVVVDERVVNPTRQEMRQAVGSEVAESLAAKDQDLKEMRDAIKRLKNEEAERNGIMKQMRSLSEENAKLKRRLAAMREEVRKMGAAQQKH